MENDIVLPYAKELEVFYEYSHYFKIYLDKMAFSGYDIYIGGAISTMSVLNQLKNRRCYITYEILSGRFIEIYRFL